MSIHIMFCSNVNNKCYTIYMNMNIFGSNRSPRSQDVCMCVCDILQKRPLEARPQAKAQ